LIKVIKRILYHLIDNLIYDVFINCNRIIIPISFNDDTEENNTWISAADVTLEAKSDKPDILLSSWSSLEKGDLYWRNSFPLEALLLKAPC
jgi:hypothetical protein